MSDDGAPRIAVPAALSPAAFHRRRPGAAVIALGGETMGTSWSAHVVVPDAGAPRALEAAILAELGTVIAQMSQWEPGSDICRFNTAPIGQWHALPPAFSEVLRAALEIGAASGGAFNPAVGRLADLWGFGPAGPRGTLPPIRAIAEALAGSTGAIEHDAALLRARRVSPATLDFSGIAKGYAVDAVARRLLALGLPDFLVEIGGELRGEGIKPDGQPWWVLLEPAPGSAAAPIRVALHGLAVATSGNYARGFDRDGRRYSHTLDPRTGWPIDTGVASVSVLHAETMAADAWATALTVLGPDEGMALAARQGLAAHMLVRDDDTEHELFSPALRAMLDG